MKLIINHRRLKRVVNGAFSICCDLQTLEQLKEVIDKKIEQKHIYGWINFNEFELQPETSDHDIIKVTKCVKNSNPIGWNE